MCRAVRPALLATCLYLPAAAALAQGAASSQDQQPGTANTQQNRVPGPAGEGSPKAQPSPGQPGWLADLFTPGQTTFLGNIYGLRTVLGDYGISLGLQDTEEVFGNPTGGIHTAVSYNGLTAVSLGIDTSKRLGIPGGTLNVSAFQIHGRNYALEDLGTLQTTSGIEAVRSTRLWEIWYQQALIPDRLDIKIGQQSLDQEFLISPSATLFINTAAGWPVLPSVDLYAGGPAYPLSSLGVRLRGQPAGNVTVLGGVFDDNPPGGPFFNDSQVRGASQSGTKFNTGTGALFIGEVQYSINQPSPGKTADGAEATGLPGTYKLGGFYDTGKFYDQRVDAAGVPLADSNSFGIGRTRRGNWTLYGVADQTVWRPGPQGPQAVNVFARIMGAPGDRNLVSFAVHAGVTLKAPLPGRDNDAVGLGYGIAKIGPNTVRMTQDTALMNTGFPVRGSENMVELTYQAQIAPWWVVQPDFQYVWTPAGGVPNPGNPAKRIGNSAVFGLRTNVTF